MFDRTTPMALPRVLLVAEDQVHVTITRKGERSSGQTCQLTIAVNGEEAMSFIEDAGSDAPRAAIIDLDAPVSLTSSLLDAFRTKPWQHADTPVITYSMTEKVETGEATRDIGYLVRNQPIIDVINAIRETLDLPRPTG